MEDLIERARAIEIIHELQDSQTFDQTADMAYDLVDWAISEIPSAQPDKDMIHLQKEQAYMQGWEEGRKALREEIWENGRDRLD